MRWPKPGWCFEDYRFEDLYDASLSVRFEYKGKEYRISCEGDRNLYDDETNEVLWHFNSEKEFYSGVIFGRPIQEVIDESHMISLF